MTHKIKINMGFFNCSYFNNHRDIYMYVNMRNLGQVIRTIRILECCYEYENFI